MHFPPSLRKWLGSGLDFGNDLRLEKRRRAAEEALRVEISWLQADGELRARLCTGRTDVVLGLAMGYGVRELAPFVLSLRGCGYRGEVVLFSTAGTPETNAFLRAHNIRSVPSAALHKMPMSMNSARFFRYLDWLAEQALNAPEEAIPRRILLCDVRDAVFQSNPFAAADRAELRFHMETGPTIGACPTNSEWISRTMGEAVLAEIGACPVSCAGTLIGGSTLVYDYLLEMVSLMNEVPVASRFTGVDQAIHNVILWRDLIPGSKVIPNGSEVLTVPEAGIAELAILDGHVVRNANGSTSAIIHQYDRDPTVRAAIEKAYAV